MSGITCYKRDEALCTDEICLRDGCRLTRSSTGSAEPPTQEFVLRAMAANYAGGHSWDHLDGETCTKAADEIKTLRAGDGYRAAWLELIDLCNRLKEENFQLRHGRTRDVAQGSLEARDNDIGILLSALRYHEEAVGETFDDEGGIIAQIEADHKARQPALIASSVSSTQSATPPDWKQDQAETSRLAPKLTSTPRTTTDAFDRAQGVMDATVAPAHRGGQAT